LCVFKAISSYLIFVHFVLIALLQLATIRTVIDQNQLTSLVKGFLQTTEDLNLSNSKSITNCSYRTISGKLI